ncbi:hypothetical protein CEUSTIGMA_g1980.t1 [Chlamydomonas eustigma]|uniref:Uncharacterized protein n=1 Tax=Chlamydomonas eustigma TaxID=1157962 RepID=A0A250WUP7_9CHLO|nr:hypothetical protein CEUSTIGMA_g1980.t1 [Chlamydomonas eustigma]|eukprot:GAX74531.1 hypothetical protein CEUSTIGMA_g1980.t1 [Chlamydomonas eustigma]
MERQLSNIADKLFSNPFKKLNLQSEIKQREAARLKLELETAQRQKWQKGSSPRTPHNDPSSSGARTFRRLDTVAKRQLSTEECLASVRSLLEQLRQMNPNDVHAFPLLNESQRLVQQLRETPNAKQGPDKEAWLIQIGDLQNEVQGQTERLVSSASARPPPQPVSGPGIQQAQAVASALAAQRQAAAQQSSTQAPLSTPSRPVLQKAVKNNSMSTASGSAVPVASLKLNPSLKSGNPAFGPLQQQPHPEQGHAVGPLQQQPHPEQGHAVGPSQTSTSFTVPQGQAAAARIALGLTGKIVSQAFSSAVDTSGDARSQKQGPAIPEGRTSVQSPARRNSTLVSTRKTAATTSSAVDDLFSGLSVLEAESSSKWIDGLVTATAKSAASAAAEVAEGYGARREVADASSSSSSSTMASVRQAVMQANGHSPLLISVDSGAMSQGQDMTLSTMSTLSPSVHSTVTTAANSWSAGATAGATTGATASADSSSTSIQGNAGQAAGGSEASPLRLLLTSREVSTPAASPIESLRSKSDMIDMTTGEAEGVGKRSIKKKTRGLKVGYGNIEDPMGPSTSASPRSAFSTSSSALGGAPSRLLQGSSSASRKTAEAIEKAQAAVEEAPRPMWPPPQQQQQSFGMTASSSSSSSGKQSSSGSRGVTAPSASNVAARRLNLPVNGFMRTSNSGSSAQPLPDHTSSTSTSSTSQAANSVQKVRQAPAEPSSHSLVSGQMSSVTTHEKGSNVSHTEVFSAGTSSLPSSGPPPLLIQAEPSQPGKIHDLSTPGGRLAAYLGGLSGTLPECRKIAKQVAEGMAQQLEAAMSTALHVEQEAWASRRKLLADASEAEDAVGKLESLQALAGEAEEFEEAAALGERMQGLRSQALSLRAGAQQKDQEAGHQASQRLNLISQKAQVWDELSQYYQHLSKLQARHITQWEACSSHQNQEIEVLEQQQAQVSSAINEARSYVEARRVELETRRIDLEARMKVAAGPLYTEHEKLAISHSSLQADVNRLLAMLSEKQQELQRVSLQLTETSNQMKQHTAQYTAELDTLQADEVQLEVQQASLRQQEGLLSGSRDQALKRKEEARQQREVLAEEARELAAEAESFAECAEAVRKSGEVERGWATDRQVLLDKETSAREQEAALMKCIEEIQVDLTALQDKRAKLTAEVAVVQQQAAVATQALPGLEAAKKEAAARKDFKEAAKLSAEAKALMMQHEDLLQRVQEVMVAASQAAVAEASKSSELEQMKLMVPEVQKEVASAHLTYLQHCIQNKQISLNLAVQQEGYEEAQKLQTELESDLAEVTRLAAKWDLQSPVQDPVQTSTTGTSGMPPAQPTKPMTLKDCASINSTSAAPSASFRSEDAVQESRPALKQAPSRSLNDLSNLLDGRSPLLSLNQLRLGEGSSNSWSYPQLTNLIDSHASPNGSTKDAVASPNAGTKATSRSTNGVRPEALKTDQGAEATALWVGNTLFNARGDTGSSNKISGLANEITAVSLRDPSLSAGLSNGHHQQQLGASADAQLPSIGAFNSQDSQASDTSMLSDIKKSSGIINPLTLGAGASHLESDLEADELPQWTKAELLSNEMYQKANS